LTIAFLAALVAVNIAYLIFLDRNDARAKLERDADREERQTLLQRIQAPHVAVVDHSQQQHEHTDNGLPMSDEQLAEQEERQRVFSFIETFENGSS
jgi:hypothetical protein